MYRQNDITCETAEKGWIIEYDGHATFVNYEALPKKSVQDFVMGYARCLLINEGWLKC